MRTSFTLVLLSGLAAWCIGASADAPKVPLQSDDKGTLYIQPNTTSTEKSIETQGATVGIERPDGSGASTGIDTSGTRPTYSVGASTGGKVSYSAGVQSDGKDNKAVKAGVTIKY